MTHPDFMDRAIVLAETALQQGEFPVGCLLVADGRIIADGARSGTARRGGRETPANEIDHAEMVALRRFYRRPSPVEPGRITLYSTMEPCLMCFAAILLSGIRTVVYAYEDVMGGGTSCDIRQLAPLYRDREIRIIPHVRRDESLALFKRFFKNRGNEYWKDSLLAEYTLAAK